MSQITYSYAYDPDNSDESLGIWQARMYRLTHADAVWFALHTFDNWLRTEIKHGDREELQEVRDRLHDTLEAYETSIEGGL